MEQKPETGKSTDKTKNACYTSTIKANEKEIREETIMVIRLFCAAGMSTSLLVKKMEEAAKEKGIVVCNVPTYATESVTQHVFAMLFAITNRIYEHAQSVKMGEWQKAPDFSYRKTPIFEIANQTMGIVGMGRIGQSVARVAKAFGMKVLCYSKHPHPELEDEQLHFVSLEELLSN